MTTKPLSRLGAFNLGGVNASGQVRLQHLVHLSAVRLFFLIRSMNIQVPDIPGHRGLIDVDTPQEAYTKTGWRNGETLELVFSDEFNVDGRTFYPGDDPYWEAVDLHYWETNNLEW